MAGLGLIAWACLSASLAAQPAADSPLETAHETSDVRAWLVIPEQSTWVIGDPIPLLWRFRNETDSSLAFMWEGCCRQNGRLDIRLEGEPIPPIPPSQALAHMFARAALLKPGEPEDFETRLSDWVELPRSGAYSLQGRYVGVLPSQKPQVLRKDVELWRDATRTTPLKLNVLSPSDYLAQREERARKRELTTSVAGPGKLPLLESCQFEFKIENTGAQALEVDWPNTFRLWLVNADGRRVTGVPAAIDAVYERIAIAPGETATRTFDLEPDRLEGTDLGAFQLFVDLDAAGPGQPRLPSNTIPVHWTIDRDDVRDLLTRAAEGADTGRRNPALKLLRVYLADIALDLASLPAASLSPAAGALQQELKLAACLKTVLPTPGSIDLALVPDGSGNWRIENPLVASCLSASTNTSRIVAAIERLAQVRRHLGWRVSVTLRPSNGATRKQAEELHESLRPFQRSLGGRIAISTP